MKILEIISICAGKVSILSAFIFSINVEVFSRENIKVRRR
jgi:hypothetical protein